MLKEIIKFIDNDINTDYNASIIIELLHKQEISEQLLLNIIIKEATNIEQTLNFIAVKCYENSFTECSLTLLMEALKHSPLDDNTLYNLGYICFRLGNNVTSLNLLKRISNKDNEILTLISEIEDLINPEEVESKAVGLIFSKDRAMQLEATLSSFLIQCEEAEQIDLKVLYTTSNANFENQYKELMNQFPKIQFIKEFDFRQQVLECMNNYDYIMFGVDDDLFVKPFKISFIINLLSLYQNAIGYSLRLGRNIDYSYMLNTPQEQPEFVKIDDETLIYNWVNAKVDFGYSLEVSSSIYRTSDILALLKDISFTNPNSLEAEMAKRRSLFMHTKPLILCGTSSRAFCNPINLVQTEFLTNRYATNIKYSVSELRELFDKGYRINVVKYKGFTPSSCHFEVEMQFINKNPDGMDNPEWSKFMGDFNKFYNLQKQIPNELRRFPLIAKEDAWPCMNDNSENTSFDRHYIYHLAWAARKVKEINPEKHMDFSSSLHFSTMISAFIPTAFLDYRPAVLEGLDHLSSKSVDLTALPFGDNSINSISCMHVVEHIGLGRYGDPFDIDGDLKAISELTRVLSDEGSLLFVVPIGKKRIQYNAHRIYSYDQILSYFKDLELIEYALIPDKEEDGGLIVGATAEMTNKQSYGCGCFWFKKTQKSSSTV